MRVLIFKALMFVVAVLEFAWLVVAVPSEFVVQLLRRCADWAEVQWLLAVVAAKLRNRQ